MKKKYVVNCDIVGTAAIFVSANSLEEARKRLKEGNWDDVSDESYEVTTIEYETLEELFEG